MAYCLARADGDHQRSVIKRFDPRFWTVNFPRPMMAAVTTTGPQSLRVDTVFYRANDLAGLIWEAEDRYDHPLLAYETARDFRGCVLQFDWKSAGIRPLDAVNGPTLTIEGRDASGAPRTWFVRLWNYATGVPEDAHVTLDFAALDGGFLLPAEADAVYAGDIDRMFITLVPPGYATTATPLPAAVEGWVTLDAIGCDGRGSVLTIGDALIPAHLLSVATGYDDSYNITPARMLRSILHLGYRGSINHYVGMSHYFRLELTNGSLYASVAGGAINTPCTVWHRDFAARSEALDYALIVSLSYELFDQHCWPDWKQRAWNGDPALTGYTPPSTLLSPANSVAMGYLKSVARAFMNIAVGAGHAPRFQVGEPWWWVMPDGRICLYDGAARAALGGNPIEIATIKSATLSAAQTILLDSAGAILAASTASLAGAVRADHPLCQTLILVYLPTVLDDAAPHAKRANVPLGWAAPAFDILQLEDYDWVTAGNVAASARGVAAAVARLGYPARQQHYFAGFVLSADDQAQWQDIEAATRVAQARGVAATYVWALPQVIRDGFTYFAEGDGAVDAFDDVNFPLALGRSASVSPEFSTAVVTSSAGYEQRNSDWASARMRYDAGPGIRSESDVQALIAFFRARRGAAKAFRFRDPFDNSSNGMTGTPTAADQIIGTGDGVATQFTLVKRYGAGPDAELRTISHPVAGSTLIAVGGAATGGWTVAGGTIGFSAPPPNGSVITAGFRFDVPVRFENDQLLVESATFLAGDAASVPLIEVRVG